MNTFILQHDGALYHGGFCVRVCLLHPQSGRATDRDLKFLQWPPGLPHFTPIDIVFGGKKYCVCLTITKIIGIF